MEPAFMMPFSFLDKGGRFRVLLFFALACLFLLSSNPAFLGVAFVIGLGLCLISGMNVRHIGIRLAGPAFVALGLVAVRVWLSPENGGIADGTVLAGRVLAICTWAMPLMANGQLQETLQALAPFRLPVFLLDTLLLASRFAHDLRTKGHEVVQAQRVRLGYRGLSGWAHSLGALGGQVLSYAFDRALALEDTMKVRCVGGKLYPQEPPAPSIGAAAVAFFMFFGMWTLSWLL
jgi:energy-coupling factor transporter transmembrane protein EcfT